MKLSLANLFLLGALAAPQLDLKFSSTDGNNFYSVQVEGEQWLQSGQLEGFFNQQWYTANKTKANAQNDFQLMNLISQDVINNRVDDFGGSYNEYIFEWQAGTTIFETNFKVYHDLRAISFVQSFPTGATGTAYISNPPVPRGCSGNGYQPPPFLTFPSFNIDNKTSMYATGDLNYLTWYHTFSVATWGKAPVRIEALAGIDGGPVVLFTNESAILVSTNDNFAVSTQVNQLPNAANTAMYMEDPDRNDSLLCISSTCYKANYAYESKETEGSSAGMDDEDIVALTLWYSDKYQDTYVATTSSPPDSSYQITFNNGYVYTSNDAGNTRLALDLYYNSAKQDHATVATEDLKKKLENEGYKLIGTQGYLAPFATQQTNDWRLGIASTVLSIPAGFQHEAVIVAGYGINDVVRNEWSRRLLSLYHTNRISGDKDIVTSRLGYWTDDGAYYYGDSWGATTDPLNLTCCSLEVFEDVKKKLDEMEIPIGYWQMDDWWYIGDHPTGGYWGGVKAVKHWEPPSAYYPGGLAALSKAIQVPLLLYGPYFSTDNDWIGDFSFIPEAAGYVLPSPEDSYGFYSALLDFGINASTTDGNTGMIGYEVDFMSCLGGTPEFRTRIGAEHEWLKGMNQAAAERGLGIQYCMAAPMELMESLSFSQVTNGRASGDYALSGNWDIGAGSLLWSALDLHPSKDNFWTSFNEPVPPENHPAGLDHNSTELHAIAAVMSTGPVGISDRAGWSNATLIMRLCRADGRLLQPKRPITAIDDQFLSGGINVWSTEFGPYLNPDVGDDVEILGYPVLAINMQNAYDLNYKSFTPPLNENFMYIVRKWNNYTNCKNGSLAVRTQCVQLVQSKSSKLYTLSPQPVIPPMRESFELIHVLQNVDYSSIVFLGELWKYVSASQHRFNSLMISGSSLSVEVRGKPQEVVMVSILKPTTQKNDWTLLTYNVTIEASGKTQFNL